MIRGIVKYGHPALRARGAKAGKPDARIRKLAEDLIETMRSAEGVGLAAQQIGMPLQVCVVDAAGIPDRPSRMWVGGREVDPAAHMPMVLVNPELEKSGAIETEVEGCLSFPGVSGNVPRPARVRVRAMDLEGRELDFEAAGLLGRAIQHEHDHLHGILFIDHMSPEDLEPIRDALRKLQREAG